MIVPRGTAGAQSARQPGGASSAQSARQPVGTASTQSVIPTAYAMPQSVVLPIADTALLTARMPAAIRSAAGSQRVRKKKIDWQRQ